MVDIDLFKKVLDAEDNGYIVGGDRITIDLLKLFSNYTTDKVSRLFKKSKLYKGETTL